jgi:hypothetical protein
VNKTPAFVTSCWSFPRLAYTMHGHMSRCTVTCHDARSHERKIKHVIFYDNVRRSSSFCSHRIFTEVVFVTQLSGNAGISV